MNRASAAALALALWCGSWPGFAQEPAQDTGPDREPAASADPTPVVGPPRATPLSGAALDERTEEVAALLRCPVCQGLSVADSRASMAVKMKQQVREMLARGYDRDQVLSYFERSYGEFVRLEPALGRGFNWVVWVAPVLGLLGGLLFVGRLLRAPTPPGPEAQEPASVPVTGTAGPDPVSRGHLPDDIELAGYVLRVRELAYGWAGGKPPGSAA